MGHNSKALLLFFAFLLVSSQSQSGGVQGFSIGKDAMKPTEVVCITQNSVKMKSRKVLEELVQLDYDDAGPNPKHNPRRGGGSRNP